MSNPDPAHHDDTATLYDAFRRARDRAPQAPAAIHGETVVSYAALDASAREIASGLTSAGVGVGDRVMVYSPNAPEFLAIYLACSYLGAVFAPANVGFKAREMQYICENARASVAFVHVAVLDDFRRHTADSPHVPDTIVAVGADGAATPDGTIALARFRGPAADGPSYAARPEDPALICFTSGTTSSPKPVLHGHGSEVYSALTYAAVHDLGPKDRGIVAMPMAWAYGLTTSSAALLAAGSAIVLLDRFSPTRYLEAVERYEVTVLYATMSMYTKMLSVLASRPFSLESVRLCINGGESCPDPAIRAFEGATGLQLVQAYAASEVRPVASVYASDTDPPRETAGRLVPGAHLRIVDSDGEIVTGVGVPGEAEMTSPGQMLGYYREEEKTREKVTPDGWIRSGDLVVRDDRGFFFVVGRKSEMIIRSGANVAPAEVESAILDLDEVDGVGVVGIPDPVSGEEVIAFVVPRGEDTVDGEAIRRRLGETLASYKVPTRFLNVEAIPLNASGKTDRSALKALAHTRLARATDGTTVVS